MAERPAVNSNVDDIADRAKHGYATGTKLLAEAQYRLAELAGTDRLDPDESIRLQEVLADIWRALYSGTTYAVRDEDTDDDTWDEADNTYSDGRAVMVQTRIEPWESRLSIGNTTDSCWAKALSTSTRSERSATSRLRIPKTTKSSTWAMKPTGLKATGRMAEDRALARLFAVPGPVFTARYRGKWGLCGQGFPKGERICYVAKKAVAHEGCAVSSSPVNPVNDSVLGAEERAARYGPERNQPQPTVVTSCDVADPMRQRFTCTAARPRRDSDWSISSPV